MVRLTSKQQKQLAAERRDESRAIIELRQSAAHLVNHVYSSINGKRISKEAGVVPSIASELTYGEIDILAFIRILGSIRPTAGDIFYDLGCGAGKAVIIAGLAFPFEKCIGIELIEGLCGAARHALSQCISIVDGKTSLSLPQVALDLEVECKNSETVSNHSTGSSTNPIEIRALGCSDESAGTLLLSAVLTELNSRGGCCSLKVDLAPALVRRLGHKAYKRGLLGHSSLLKFLQRQQQSWPYRRPDLPLTEGTTSQVWRECLTVLDGDRVELVQSCSSGASADDPQQQPLPQLPLPHQLGELSAETAEALVQSPVDNVVAVAESSTGTLSHDSALTAAPLPVACPAAGERKRERGGGSQALFFNARVLQSRLESGGRTAISFVHGNILDVDWSDAGVVYAASLLFGDDLMEKVALRAERLRPGAKFITVRSVHKLAGTAGVWVRF